MIRSVNPFNNELIGEFETLDLDALDLKLTRALQGLTVWRNTGFDDRSHFLRSLANVLRDGKEEYAHLISNEMGKVINESRKEVEKCAVVLDYFAEHGPAFLAEEKADVDKGEGRLMYEPMGVILGVMPWNYPFWQVFRFVASTVMAGNVVLLKHSSQVPACSQKILEIIDKAELPGGVFQNLLVSSDMVSHIIKDFRVQGASLTGSEPAGAQVAQQAGKHIKKVVLELGGSDPFIVLEDADVASAVKAGVHSRFMNFGQSCDAAKRFILHESIALEFLEAFQEEIASLKYGSPLSESSDYACLVSKKQKEVLEQQVKESLDAGATIFWQASRPADASDAYFTPMILRDIPENAPAYKDELFGPVASVFIVTDGMEAVRQANDTDYGLGASIWTADLERGWKMAREVQAGIVSINDAVHSKPQLPFGGVKKSGVGREMAAAGIREFTNKKSLTYPLD